MSTPQQKKQQTVEETEPAAIPITEPASVQQRTDEQTVDVSVGQAREAPSMLHRADEQVVGVSAKGSRGEAPSVPRH